MRLIKGAGLFAKVIALIFILSMFASVACVLSHVAGALG